MHTHARKSRRFLSPSWPAGPGCGRARMLLAPHEARTADDDDPGPFARRRCSRQRGRRGVST